MMNYRSFLFYLLSFVFCIFFINSSQSPSWSQSGASYFLSQLTSADQAACISGGMGGFFPGTGIACLPGAGLKETLVNTTYYPYLCLVTFGTYNWKFLSQSGSGCGSGPTTHPPTITSSGFVMGHPLYSTGLFGASTLACEACPVAGSTSKPGLLYVPPVQSGLPVPGTPAGNMYGVNYDPNCREYRVTYTSSAPTNTSSVNYPGAETNVVAGCFSNSTDAAVLLSSNYYYYPVNTSYTGVFIGSSGALVDTGSPCAASYHYCRDGYLARSQGCVAPGENQSLPGTYCSPSNPDWHRIY